MLEREHGFADALQDLTCPLCPEHVGSGKASHMAQHLEEVSLTILPANAGPDEESEEIAGDHAGEEASFSGGPSTQSSGEEDASVQPSDRAGDAVA